MFVFNGNMCYTISSYGGRIKPRPQSAGGNRHGRNSQSRANPRQIQVGHDGAVRDERGMGGRVQGGKRRAAGLCGFGGHAGRRGGAAQRAAPHVRPQPAHGAAIHLCQLPPGRGQRQPDLSAAERHGHAHVSGVYAGGGFCGAGAAVSGRRAT